MRSNMARVVVRFAALAAITALVNVGVAAANTYVVKKVDTDFFDTVP